MLKNVFYKCFMELLFTPIYLCEPHPLWASSSNLSYSASYWDTQATWRHCGQRPPGGPSPRHGGTAGTKKPKKQLASSSPGQSSIISTYSSAKNRDFFRFEAKNIYKRNRRTLTLTNQAPLWTDKALAASSSSFIDVGLWLAGTD
jgi:hypothetical protein